MLFGRPAAFWNVFSWRCAVSRGNNIVASSPLLHFRLQASDLNSYLELICNYSYQWTNCCTPYQRYSYNYRPYYECNGILGTILHGGNMQENENMMLRWSKIWSLLIRLVYWFVNKWYCIKTSYKWINLNLFLTSFAIISILITSLITFVFRIVHVLS